MAQAEIKAIITADDRASRVIRGVDNSMSSLARTAGRALKAGLIAGAAAMTGLTAFVWKSVKAFAEEEVVVARLKRGIQNVTSATNHNVDSLIKQASALQTVTRFADDQIISAQGILTTYQLNQRQIEALTPRLLDMAEGIATVDGGMADLEGTAHLVAKALGGEDVVGLAGSLRRVGVIMTEHQTEVLKTGNMQERLATITQILDGNFKGMAKAAGSTTSGAMIQLQNALGDLQEEFGGVIAEAITPFIKKLTDWARTDEARKTVRDIANRVVDMGKAFGTWLKENWPGIKSALKTMASLAAGAASSIKDIAHAIDTLTGPFQWLANKISDATAPGKWTGPASPGASGARGGIGGSLLRQHGGSVLSGASYIVGEKGPELFTPPPGGGQITPNSRVGANRAPINFSVNVGVYAGSQMEKRRIASELWQALNDVAAMENMTAAQMLGG